MGLDVTICAKDENIECDFYYSRKFADMFSYYVGGEEGSELPQIGKLFNVDVSVFKNMAETQPEPNHIELQLFLAEEENNVEKIKYYKTKIEEYERNWDFFYETSVKGWIQPRKLLEVAIVLLESIENNPDYYKQLRFCRPQEQYFTPVSIVRVEEKYLEKINIDLRKIVNHLHCLIDEGAKFVTFVYT